MDKEEESIDNLKKELEECQKLRDEYLASWQRERADFLNYKKEEMTRVGDFLKYANVGLILKILPILDDFEVALKNSPDKGFLQIKEKILSFLKEQGVEEIKSVGEKFDPNFHEAVEDVSAQILAEPGVKMEESGMILEEIQKGYTINGRLLRPAKVKVIK